MKVYGEERDREEYQEVPGHGGSFLGHVVMRG
jgi:hypothetical protein